MVSNLNLLESRRRILLTTPHLESPTPANPLTFKSNMTTKLKEGKVYFTPVQEGTGDPSPDNVRPILGWDGVTLNVNGTVIAIPFPQTIYGGYVDLVNGKVVEEYGAFEFTGDENICYATNWNAKGNYYVNTYGVVPFCSQSDVNNIYCNVLKPRSSSFFGVNEGMVTTQGADTDVKRVYRYIIIGKDGFGETVSECKAKLKELYDAGTPLTVVSKYAKAFVKTYTLTPETIKTLKGTNTIWSDANGNIEIKFWKH